MRAVAALTAALLVGCGGQAAHPRPTRTPTPIPTTQASAAQAWRDAITPAMDRLGAAIDGLQVACAADEPPGLCQIGYGDVQTAAQGLERALDTNLAPGCLTDSAAQLRQAAGLIDAGSASMAQGTVRASLAGAAVMQDAMTHLRAARDEARVATCQS